MFDEVNFNISYRDFDLLVNIHDIMETENLGFDLFSESDIALLKKSKK